MKRLTRRILSDRLSCAPALGTPRGTSEPGGGPVGDKTRGAVSLQNGKDALEPRRSEGLAGTTVDLEMHDLSDAAGDANARDTARRAGINLTVLNRMLSSIEPEERNAILTLCAQDLDRTRQAVAATLREWDPDGLARHLHVMSSLAATVGADALADETRRMQARLLSGATSGHEVIAERMDDLARKAARFLAEVAE